MHSLSKRVLLRFKGVRRFFRGNVGLLIVTPLLRILVALGTFWANLIFALADSE